MSSEFAPRTGSFADTIAANSRNARRMRAVALEERRFALLHTDLDGLLDDWRAQRGGPVTTTGIPGDAFVVDAQVARPSSAHPWQLRLVLCAMSFEPVAEGATPPEVRVWSTPTPDEAAHWQMVRLVQGALEEGDDAVDPA